MFRKPVADTDPRQGEGSSTRGVADRDDLELNVRSRLMSDQKDKVGVIKLGRNGSHTSPGSSRITAVDVLGSADELTDWTGGSTDVIAEANIDPKLRSRLELP